jgi:long-chain acyl-CoA synthetase
LVANLCVYANQNANRPIAIIIPHEVNLRHALQSKPDINSGQGLSALCHDNKVKELVLKECNAVGKKNGFKPLEILQAVVLTPDEWTPESGLVTAAQKIQRSKISKAFAKEISVGCLLASSRRLLTSVVIFIGSLRKHFMRHFIGKISS